MFNRLNWKKIPKTQFDENFVLSRNKSMAWLIDLHIFNQILVHQLLRKI